MKNRIITKYLSLIAVLTLIVISVIYFTGCVESITDPTSITGGTTEIGFNITYPVDGDTIRMGQTPVYYTASDGLNGPGLSYYELFVNGVSTDLFFQKQDGSNPLIFINTDSIESRVGINPKDFPEKIQYFITAYNKNHLSKTSATFTNVFVNRKPETPANMLLTRITDKSFNLIWDDLSSNEDNYELWRKDGVNSGYFKIYTLPANNFGKVDYVQSDIINYFYKVRATNIFGVSEFSNEVSSSGVAGGSTPTNLIAEALGASKMQLTWTDNSNDELGFRIQRRNPFSGIFEQIAIVVTNTTEYFDFGLSAATTYAYRVASFTNSSQSSWSTEAWVTTYGTDINGPSKLVATFNKESNSVLVQWSDDTQKENGTLIERRLGLTGQFTEIGLTKTDTYVFYDSEVEAGNTYYYRARHTTVEGFRTPFSNTDSAYVPVLPPNAPSNLTINEFTAGVLYGLSWKDNSEDEDGFEIWRKDGIAGAYYLLRVFDPNIKAYNDSIPSASLAYFYRVRAFRDGLYSNFTNEVSTGGSTGGLSAPSNLRGDAVIGTNKIQLQWDDNSTSELGFAIERRHIESTVFAEVKRVAPNATQWLDESQALVKGTSYVYRIRAYDQQFESDYSNEHQVFIPN
ncbi:MAG: hypothetical protein KKD86_16555 [Bacteroidetes bacterium]|nr:hypothetical protein [Bacteroidota bacterium]